VAVIQPQPLIPEAFLVKCQDLPEVQDGRMSSLLLNHVEVAHQFHSCAQRHGDLVDVIRKAGAKP
jgi:hypothetical protein